MLDIHDVHAAFSAQSIDVILDINDNKSLLHTSAFFSSGFLTFNGMSNDSFPFFRGHLACIGKVDFVMHAAV